MTIALVINGQTFQYPEVDDEEWGIAATNWAYAVTNGMLQKAGGTFQLLADVNFGTTYGLLSQYYKTRTTNIATGGQFRLARADVISWRNEANGGNLDLGVNSSDVLTFNGIAVGNFVSVDDTSSIDLTLTAGVLTAVIAAGGIVNSMVSASAAIAFSKMEALTLSRALVSDGSGIVSVATTTATEIGYVNGVTSAIQTQLDSKQATGNYITVLTGDVTATGPGSVAATIAAGAVDNAKISASAAIAFSKLAALTSGNILVGSAGNVATSVTMSGDATIIASGAITIANNAVTNAKAAQMAAHTFKGNNTGSTANSLDLTATQLTAELDTMVGDSGSGGTKGLVPAPASGDATKFLNGGGSWSVPAGAGDVSGPASAVADNIVSFNGTTGKTIKDSGVAAASVVVGPASATDSCLALFDGTTGKLLKDSAITGSSVVTTILNQYNTDIGNSSNVRTAVNTNIIGDSKASIGSATFTVTIATPGVFTYNSHGFYTGQQVYFTTTGALPTGLTASTKYYVIKIDANTFYVATSQANATTSTRVATSGSQSGVHTVWFGGLQLVDPFPIGKLVSWTPTGTWSTNTTYTGFVQRTGNVGTFYVNIALAGAPTSATLNVNMPTGLTIDTSNLPQTGASGGNMMLGSDCRLNDTGTNTYLANVRYVSTTAVQPEWWVSGSGAIVVSNIVNATVPFTFGNTDYITMWWRAPVTEWAY